MMISVAQYEAMEEFAVRSDNYARVLEDVVAMMGFERMMEIHDGEQIGRWASVRVAECLARVREKMARYAREVEAQTGPRADDAGKTSCEKQERGLKR